MDIEILAGPANTVAKVTLQQGEHLTAEGGSMVAMHGGLTVETTTHKRGQRGLARAAKRMFAGENMFLNHYSAENGEGTIHLAPALSGDIMAHHQKGGGLIVQATSFLAHEDAIDMDLGWQGLKSLFSGEGIFWLRLSGYGHIILNSFGCIYPVEVDGSYIVDSGHIVAFEEGLKFKISKAGKSWFSSFLGGEGFVCRFEGKGTVWCQSHSPVGFGRILGPLLRPIIQYQQ